MATHSSVLAWRIPGTGEPGGLPSMGSHRVGHDLSDLAAAAADKKGFPHQVSLGDIALYNGFDNTVGLYSHSTVGLPGGLMCVEKRKGK